MCFSSAILSEWECFHENIYILLMLIDKIQLLASQAHEISSSGTQFMEIHLQMRPYNLWLLFLTPLTFYANQFSSNSIPLVFLFHIFLCVFHTVLSASTTFNNKKLFEHTKRSYGLVSRLDHTICMTMCSDNLNGRE